MPEPKPSVDEHSAPMLPEVVYSQIETLLYHHQALAWMDKSVWGDGPWINEPDGVQFIDGRTKLNCLARRGPTGTWNGYVAVGSDNPFYKKDYMDGSCPLSVHGGLTYADDNAEPDAWEIMYLPIGVKDKPFLWWMGFDCAHLYDMNPYMISFLRKMNPNTVLLREENIGKYRDIHYVITEILSLSQQLAGISDET